MDNKFVTVHLDQMTLAKLEGLKKALESNRSKLIRILIDGAYSKHFKSNSAYVIITRGELNKMQNEIIKLRERVSNADV